MNGSTTTRTIAEWAEFLAERYDGTPFEADGPAYFGWCGAGIEASEDDEEGVAAAWEEGMVDDVLASISEIDWAKLGHDSAGEMYDSDLASCGYSDVNCGSTPWTDNPPQEAGEFADCVRDCTSTEVSDQIEAALDAARDAFNSAFCEDEEAAVKAIEDERAAHLARADAARTIPRS